MRFRILVAAISLAAITGPLLAQTNGPSGRPLSLDEAWRLAEQANPALRRKVAQQALIEGAAQDAGALFFNNPQISWEGTRREVPRPDQPDEDRKEWSAGVFQTLEIAGQRGHRMASADAARVAQAAEVEALRREVRATVAQQFYRVLALQQRVEIETQALALFEQTASAIARRRAAGEDTKLDANIATVEAERARSQLDAAREALIEARTELGAALQLPAERSADAVGDLTNKLDHPLPPMDQLLADLPTQPRLRALAAQEDGARARLDLERASRVPDVTVGLSVGREGSVDARERLTTLSASVPLPLFKRNAAGIGQATTDLDQARIERQAGIRDSEANVRALYARLQSLQARVQRLQRVVAPTLADNEALSRKSQRVGQIGLLELIVVSRQTLDARRDLVEALLDFQNTRLTLAQAAGLPLGAEGTAQ
ncbi:TolC family protein [Niveibacterium sp. SC-1]|uniref:TolC family protein n=1 Tax=Niveibacterium sp. SC-1 TaxID=3135646 RepID=UPI00311FECF0